MRLFDVLGAVRYSKGLLEQVEGEGISLDVSLDFEAMRDACLGLQGKSESIPVFDPDRSEVGSDNAFWLVGAAGGEIVHTQALRFFDLGRATLADHFERFAHFYCSRGLGICPQKSDVRSARLADRVTGRVCYHGEVWLHEAFRGRGLAKVLPRLGVGLAHLQWQPDYFFGLALDPQVYRGATNRYGYFQGHPAGIRWADHDGVLVRDEWLVVMEREDMLDLVKMASETVFRPHQTAQLSQGK